MTPGSRHGGRDRPLARGHRPGSGRCHRGTRVAPARRRARPGDRQLTRARLRRARRPLPSRRAELRPVPGLPARRVRRPPVRTPRVVPVGDRRGRSPGGSTFAPAACAPRTARPATWPRRARPTRPPSAGPAGSTCSSSALGSDGHIAFNEPGSSLGSRTRLKTLTARTRQDNARFFGSLDEVPRHVLTQGVATILVGPPPGARRFGTRQGGARGGGARGTGDGLVPASALQLHPHVTVVVDDAAASDLALADYHRETWAGKARLAGPLRTWVRIGATVAGRKCCGAERGSPQLTA